MRTLIKYQAADGTLFDDSSDADKRDALVRRCEEIDGLLPPHPSGSSERLQHDSERLLVFRRALVALCRDLFPSEPVFRYEPEEIHPHSWAGRFISENAPSCVNRLWFRLSCIADGYEYEQLPDEARRTAVVPRASAAASGPMSRDVYYVLDGHTPKAMSDVLSWGDWFESADRQVARNEFVDVSVSTVFLGIDHGFGQGPLPVLFETMIFGGEHDGYCERYHTWAEAEAGHLVAVALVQQPEKPSPRRGIRLEGLTDEG